MPSIKQIRTPTFKVSVTQVILNRKFTRALEDNAYQCLEFLRSFMKKPYVMYGDGDSAVRVLLKIKIKGRTLFRSSVKSIEIEYTKDNHNKEYTK